MRCGESREDHDQTNNSSLLALKAGGEEMLGQVKINSCLSTLTAGGVAGHNNRGEKQRSKEGRFIDCWHELDGTHP